MSDFRARARIPFGYRIVDGKAQIDPAESFKLKKYFSLYLEGFSMAEAAHEAGLQCSATTFRNLLKRKEYSGTDYYPAIITPEYQEQLTSEWERRKGESPRKMKEYVPKGVRIYTQFRMAGHISEPNQEDAQEKTPEDLVERMNVLYQRIRPVFRKAATG